MRVFQALAASLMCFCPLNALQWEKEEFALGYTYRSDSLNWNIADVDDMPNVLSELSWKDLRINQISAYARGVTTKQYYGRLNGDYGRIFHGRNRDSDYAGNDRTDEFSRSISNAGRGEVFDLSAALGYQFQFFCGRFRFAPLVGVSWEEQHLRLFDGVELIPEIEPIKNLHSSYKARWYGPWMGFDLDCALTNQLAFYGMFESHWTVYRGIGHWNLREDLLTDFKHRSHGIGLKVQGGLIYALKRNWEIVLLAGYETWKAQKGSHRVTMNDFFGDAEEVVTRLNGVHWHSFRFSALLGYTF